LTSAPQGVNRLHSRGPPGSLRRRGSGPRGGAGVRGDQRGSSHRDRGDHPVSRQRAQPLARGGVALALVGTLLVHTLGIALVAFGFTPPVRHEPPVYAVELVAAPLPTANTRLAPESATPPAPPAAPEAPPAK